MINIAQWRYRIGTFGISSKKRHKPTLSRNVFRLKTTLLLMLLIVTNEDNKLPVQTVVSQQKTVKFRRKNSLSQNKTEKNGLHKKPNLM